MYLSYLKLWNFRKFGSVQEDFDLNRPNLTVKFNKGGNLLIGENDSGKSAIIDAIRLVLKTHSVEWIKITEDDFYNNSKRLRIELTFEDFTDEEAKHFVEWLGWDENKKPYLKVFLDVKRTEERILPYEVRAGIDDIGSPLSAEAREYLKVTYLKPLRDAEAELVPRKNSRLSQIFIGHELFKDGDDHEIVKKVRLTNEEIKNYFKKEVKLIIDKFLKDFIDKKSTFEIADPSLRKILESLHLKIDGEKNLGLGSHNVLFIASELLHLERKNWEGLKLALIEEIEAHLHPQVQLRIIENLQERDDIQLIMTTHSPNIGSKIKLKNLYICHNGDVFPMGQGKTRLDESDYKFLERFLDVTKANMFFAKGVILVEGWAEELILPSLAKKIGINLTEKGISIVNVGSTAFLRYCKIFQREDGKTMSIPVAVITDLDIKPDEYKQIDSNKKTEKDFSISEEINKKKEKLEGQSVKVFVSPHWTLEYCLMLDNKLRELLINAIKSVFDEENRGETALENLEEEIKNILNKSSNAEIATHLYHRIFDRKRVSKASVAQYFAGLLENDDSINKEYLENIESIQYLLEAIKYVSGSE